MSEAGVGLPTARDWRPEGQRVDPGTTGFPTATEAAGAGAPVAECADLWARFLRFSHRFNLSYWTIRAASLLARRLPPPVSYGVARSIGLAVYWTWRGQRDAITANMRRVLGPAASARQVRQTARRAYVNYFSYLVDFLRFPYIEPDRLQQSIATAGWEHLERALAAGRGAICVTLHLGAFDLAGWVVARRGYPVNAIVESFEPPKLNELIQSRRMLNGIGIIPLENPTRRIINALRRNEVLALLIDRPAPDGVVVEFFGARTTIPAGPASLALKTGAALMPGFVVRRPDNTYYGQINPAIEFEPTGDRGRDIQALSQALMHALEGIVRQYPDQWYMFRPMWPERAG